MSLSAIEDRMENASRSSSASLDAIYHLRPFSPEGSGSSIPLWGCRSQYSSPERWMNCADPIAMKIIAPRDAEDAKRTVKEARWIQYLSDKYLDTKVSPNFVKSFGWYTSDSRTIKKLLKDKLIDPMFVSKEKVARILETTTDNLVVLLTEKAWIPLGERLVDALNDSSMEGDDAPMDTMLFVKSSIFQVIVTLALVQLDIPTFRHNDAHPENLLLSREILATPMTIGYAKTIYAIPPGTHIIKFWDFEFATEATGTISGPDASDNEKVIYCPVYDHTFLLNCIDDTFAQHREQIQERLDEADEDEQPMFRDMLERFNKMVVELDGFLDRALPGIRGSEGAAKVRLEGLRIDAEVQRTWKQMGIKTPAELLLDPYFDSLVVRRNLQTTK